MVEEKDLFDFGRALNHLRNGAAATRAGWKNSEISVRLQKPTDKSKMTEPYLYMIKGEKMFPLDLSCESILAEDWYLVG